MLKPVCVPCQRFFRPEKNNFYFIEGMPIGSGVTPPGNSQPERWIPYKLWASDKWKCQGCGTEILVGFGQRAISEQYMSDFEELRKRLGAEYQVNDC